MLSRASRIRRVTEHALRVLGALALVAAAWIAIRMLDERPSVIAAQASLAESLARWSTSDSPGNAHVEIERIPAPELRDWMAALERAATAVTWSGSSLPATGVAVEPIPDPRQPATIWMAAPPGAPVVIRDSLGTLASVRAGPKETGGVTVTVPHVQGAVTASVDGTNATGALRDTLEIKPVLILGRAGWEGKFVMASLEEHGWKVDARLRVSPKQVVVQGPPAPTIDIDRYSAVIALDATAIQYASAIESYVRAGGGLIAAGEAAELRAFAALLGGEAAKPSEESEFTPQPGEQPKPPRHALSLAALTNLKEDAIALERGPRGTIAAVARRVGDGRVLQVGYRETWRWRMAGAEADPVGAHRSWWSSMVSSVAYARRTSQPAAERVEPSPLASLIASIGPPSRPAVQPTLAGFLDPSWLPWLFALALAALLIEWASRRLRGAP